MYGNARRPKDQQQDGNFHDARCFSRRPEDARGVLEFGQLEMRIRETSVYAELGVSTLFRHCLGNFREEENRWTRDTAMYFGRYYVLS